MGPMGQVLGAMAGAANYERLTREPKRITTAKQAATSVVRQIPQDVNIGLVLIKRSQRPQRWFFRTCPTRQPAGAVAGDSAGGRYAPGRWRFPRRTNAGWRQ